MTASYNDLDQRLKKHGFAFVTLSDTEPEAEALYRKPRAGGASLYVTVPFNRDNIPDSVVHQIMKTAKIDYDDYADIVSSLPTD